MKNLQNFGVQEMSTKEMKNVNGGFWGRVAKFVYDTLAGAAGSAILDAAANSLTYEQRSDYYKYRGM